MIYLPAAAGRTTRLLRRGAWAVGCTTAALAVAVAAAYAIGARSGHGLIYAAIGLGAGSVIAVGLLIGACLRSLVTQGTTALAAELAAQRETERQMVAELARLRATVRDSNAERAAEINRLCEMVERVEAERRARSREQIAAMATLRGQVWRLAAALEQRAKESGDRAKYWRLYSDVMHDLAGITDDETE